jgi:predicted DNA-binding transcriptional regulator AlpA
MRSLLTTRQLADYLGTSERHVERMRVAGTGPKFMRLGKDKAVRYEPADVETWVELQRVSSTSEEVAAGRRSHKVKTQIEKQLTA